MPDLGRPRAPAGPSRRPVRLQRNLEHDRAARARDLLQQRNRVGHVLEHVRQDAQVIRAAAGGQMRAVIQHHGVDLRTRASDRDGRLADLRAVQAPAEAARAQLAQQRAVAAPHLERAGGADASARAQRDHVVGLADRPQRAPARMGRGRGWVLRVGALVEAR